MMLPGNCASFAYCVWRDQFPGRCSGYARVTGLEGCSEGWWIDSVQYLQVGYWSGPSFRERQNMPRQPRGAAGVDRNG